MSMAVLMPVVAFGARSAASAASAASPASPASPTPMASLSPSEMLASMLLTASDLPPGMTAEGITDGSAFTMDTADFLVHGGLGIAERTWRAETPGAVSRVLDFRFLFPSPEEAQAYLAVAGPMLSEAASGLSEVAGDPQVGEGYRHLAGETAVEGQAVSLHDVFFRIGPVVAKVVVSGSGTTAADVLPIVTAASDRILSPTVSVEPSPAPTASTEPSPGPSPAAVDPSGAIHQWAAAATASDEYSSFSQWSAESAVGPPDVAMYGDSQFAWTPKLEDGTTDWLDLRYAQAVIPSGLRIVESADPGFVTRVEAYHTAQGAWITLWEGADTTPTGATGAFAPPLARSDVAVDRIRVTIDTNVPGWNEIDAVELVGTPPGR